MAGDELTGSNMYAYCNGNPVMYVDPSGMASFSGWAIIGVALLIAGAAIMTILSGVSVLDTLSYMQNLAKLSNDTYIDALNSAMSNPKLVYDQYRLAVILLGEVGFGSGAEYEKGIRAMAHCMINLVSYGIKTEISFAEMDPRIRGYNTGLSHLNNYSASYVAWDYAFNIAGHLKSGNYSAIQRPDGITDRHISNYQRSTWNGNKWKNEAELLVYIGLNIFYAEKRYR